MSKPIKTKKTFLVDVTGVVIAEDEWDNTTIHITRDGEWCEYYIKNKEGKRT